MRNKRFKLKMGYWMKLSKGIIDDTKLCTALIEGAVRRLIKTNLRKGKKPMNFEIGFFQDGRDFIENKTTVRIQYNLIKIPRIANALRLPNKKS